MSSCLRGTPCASVPVCLPAPLGISTEVAMITSAASYRWTLPRAQLCAERCPRAPLGSPATAPRSHRTERGTEGRMPCSRSPAGEVIQATSESPGLSHPRWRISTWTWEPRLRAGSMSLCARARWFHAPPAGKLRSRDSLPAEGALCPWCLSRESPGLPGVWPEQASAGNPPWSGLRIWKSSGQLTRTISPTWAGFQHVMLSHIPGQPVRERAR